MPDAVTVDGGITIQSSDSTPDQIRTNLAELDRQEAGTPAEKPPDPDAGKASEAGKALAERKSGLEARKASIQSQIDELVAERGRTARERDAIKAELAALEARKASLAVEKPAETLPTRKFAALPDNPSDPKPKKDDFEDYDDFVEARALWTSRHVLAQERQAATEAAQRDQRSRAVSSREAQFHERLASGRAKYAEFDSRMDEVSLPLSVVMQDAIKDAESPAEVMLYLADHPDEHQRILSVREKLGQYRAMVMIEARLGATSRSDAATRGPSSAAPPVSQATPPIKPLGSTPGAVISDGEPDPKTATQPEWDAYWNRKLASR